MVLTKSQVYAIVREVINYKKTHNQTSDVTAHVGETQFSSISQFIKEHADRIFINHSDRLETTVSPHLERLNYLFNLPEDIEEEYKYCLKRNGE
ncbi:late expression factor 11 [Diatraea saccharalis granulovirus]|uniref:Late expression factor 11 n=1 Tax=Diatraea saccharalis granulovirus TaxID=1675862 RepID=A0A0R7EYY3_9BBAC|nr:late expression factor 11 [Diatraea saccharalis granulovirus]AKN80792.1 late expression factor 11 [Diatraea saccharalis granulovirus]